MFYNSTNNYEYNDCVSRGACSVSPNITSMQEVMFILIRQIAYYLLQLKKYDIKEEQVEYDIISELAFIDAVKDLSEAQILDSFSKQYNNLVKVRKEYLKACKDNQDTCSDLNNLLKLSPKTNLSTILKRGDKEFLYKYKKLSSGYKYLSEILSAVLKSVCVNWINLHEFGNTYNKASDEILEALNLFNASKMLAKKLKESIDKLTECDLELLQKINETQIENFGEIEQTAVSLSTRPNKAIMVSGSNLIDLKNLLEATKDINIDIYTNGNLLIAHTFPYFKNMKNLIGHFGNSIYNSILDFATFPSAILLTKNESQNLEYLYRGRLFTTDDITPKGVVKIENNDYSQLIESAMQAKGFAKGKEKEPKIVGYYKNELLTQIDNILAKNPKKIFIIGPSNLSIEQQSYFDKFYSHMPEDTCTITFSYNPKKDNVLAINIGNDFALLYNVLKTIFDKIQINSDKLVFFLTKCDINSLSNIISLTNRGAKNIFLSDCPPLVINPAVLREFTKLFKVNHISDAENDLRTIMQ